MAGCNIIVEINENKLKELVLGYLQNEVGIEVEEKDIQILVKSKQNYRSEWESASFKATVNHFR